LEPLGTDPIDLTNLPSWTIMDGVLWGGGEGAIIGLLAGLAIAASTTDNEGNSDGRKVAGPNAAIIG
jgi:hypothetical protein